MATSGRGSGLVGYNVQTAVEAEHHLIVAHDVVMTGSDRQQLSSMAGQAKDVMGVERLDVLADRGYFSGEEILTCETMGVTPYVPKPLTSGAKADGRFGKQDFVYLPDQDVYRCPAGALLPRHMTNVENGMTLHRYWDRASCQSCALKPQCTPGLERRVTRWEHEAVIDALQRRMDLAPGAMRHRRRLVEHPFGTIKAWMGSTHFLMKRLPNVKTEIGLHILAYNLKRVIAIIGAKPLMEAIQA
jgi:transposase